MNVRDALLDASRRLTGAGAPEPCLDAELMLSHATNQSRTWLLTHPDAVPDEAGAASFARLVERRLAGEPVAYITGRREFYSLEFEVGPGVFIPRQETEGLVDLAALAAKGRKNPLLADACTGSGNVAIAARLKAGFADVHATDTSTKALAYARRNAARLGAGVAFHEGDLLEPLEREGLSGRIDVVCSNPPYVRSREMDSLPRMLEYEPVEALHGGESGLDLVARLAAQAAAMLAVGGSLIVEIGETQGREAAEMALGAGFSRAEILPDLSGADRYLRAEGPPRR